jgi:hypothetical protein
MAFFRIFILPPLLSAWWISGQAATVQVVGCGNAEVQTAINSAGNGDTVRLPAGCSATWDGGVSISGSKGLTLDGNSAAITRGGLSSGSPLVSISPSSSTTTRVTGFSFADSKQSVGYFIVVGNGSENSAKFRVDHCNFMGIGMLTHIRIAAPVYGVIDHNTLTWSTNNEVIHNEAYGAGSTAGWSNDVVPGSGDALYIEDNTFTNRTSGNPAYFWGGSAVQGYYGSRTVFRYNQVEMAAVDMHGTPGMVGARWWEIYENTFHIVPNGDMDKAIAMRGGSGVIFNNHKTGRTDYKAGIVLYEEDSGYPALYQIGRGKSQTSDPAYVWGNDSSMSVSSGSSNVQPGRDFFTTSKPGYTPYTYPHPLVNGASDSATPTTLPAPTSLRVL